MSHSTPSNSKRKKVQLFTLYDGEVLTHFQNPSDEEIREQFLTAPSPKNNKEIEWAVILHHTKNTFITATGNTTIGFQVSHQELSKAGQWECASGKLTIDQLMKVVSSYLVSDKFFYFEAFSLRSFNFAFESSIHTSMSSPQSFLCF